MQFYAEDHYYEVVPLFEDALSNSDHVTDV